MSHTASPVKIYRYLHVYPFCLVFICMSLCCWFEVSGVNRQDVIPSCRSLIFFFNGQSMLICICMWGDKSKYSFKYLCIFNRFFIYLTGEVVVLCQEPWAVWMQRGQHHHCVSYLIQKSAEYTDKQIQQVICDLYFSSTRLHSLLVDRLTFKEKSMGL